MSINVVAAPAASHPRGETQRPQPDTQPIPVVRNGETDLLDTDRTRLATAMAGDDFHVTGDTFLLSAAATVIICVPTPFDQYPTQDLTILRDACSMVVDAATPGELLMLTFTTYAGCTGDMLVKLPQQRGLTISRDIFVSFSPKRIDSGNDRFAQKDVPRGVGGANETCRRAAEALLHRYARNVYAVGSFETAEITKLLENTFHAGPGVGSHCTLCNPHYLLWQLRKEHISVPVMEHAMFEITGHPRRTVEHVRQTLADRPYGRQPCPRASVWRRR